VAVLALAGGVLFADGSSTDGTAEAAAGRYRVIHCPEGRAAQMDAAAAQATGQILTSGRRYRTGHPLAVMAKMFCLRLLYRAGVDPERIARLYRDVR